MRLLIAIALSLLLTGCTSKTEFGECIGIADEKRPDLTYKVSAQNLFWGVVGVQFIAPPIFVLVDQFYCPVGKK